MSLPTGDGSFTDYYALLGVDPDADRAVLEKRIKEEQRKWRPRTALPELGRRQEAEQRMALLAEARGVLLDDGKRAAYDRTRAARAQRRPTAAGTATGDVGTLLERAERALAINDYRTAAFFAEEAARTAASPRAWNLRARAYAGQDDHQRAVVAAQEAVDMEPGNPMYHIDLGIIHQALDEPDSAVAAFEQAAELAPEDLGPRLLIADLHLSGGRYQEAVALLEQVHREHPDDRDTRNMLAAALHDRAQAIPADRTETVYAITAKQEIAEMRPLLDRAASLVVDDPELSAVIDETREYVAQQEQKVFDFRALFRIPVAEGPAGCLVVSFLVLLFLSPALTAVATVTAFSDGVFDMGFVLLLVTALLCWGWWSSLVVPRWKQNRRASRYTGGLSR